MKLGLNLSFAVKRWLKPSTLAKMCAEDFNVNEVQFTLDLIDPWWPEKERDILAKEYKEEFQKRNVKITSVFGGVASYSYAELLSPTELQRKISVMFFKRAIDLTIALGADTFGTPIGSMSDEDFKDESARKALYNSMKESLIELAEYGKEKGLKKILIEATPLKKEFLCTPDAAKKLMEELDGKTAIPIRLLIDWGHALCRIVPENIPDMEYWLKGCSPYVDGIHLQQTDGEWDRHWDFTKQGIVSGQLIKSVTKNTGTEEITQYLEVVSIFEDLNENVYSGMKKSMQTLHEIFD